MTDQSHTPLPWAESGASDIRGEDNFLVGMVNPTGDALTQSRSRCNRTLIVRSVNAVPSLVKALEETRQYVADAGSDEDSETVKHSTSLLVEIDAALASYHGEGK